MIKVLDTWEEQNWNPSSRKQKGKGLIPAEILKETIKNDVFAKFPELVIDGPNIEIRHDVQFAMTYVVILWSCWIPTQIDNGTVTFQKIKSGLKIQLTDEVLENDPDWFFIHLKEALGNIEEQLEKTKFEFYKKGIDPRQVQSYFKYLSKATQTVFIPLTKVVIP